MQINPHRLANEKYCLIDSFYNFFFFWFLQISTLDNNDFYLDKVQSKYADQLHVRKFLFKIVQNSSRKLIEIGSEKKWFTIKEKIILVQSKRIILKRLTKT